MTQKSIIILGGQGMLGQDLAKVFAEHNPLVWDKADLDITDGDAVKKRFAQMQPKLVINAAAYNAVDDIEKSVQAQAIAQKVNVEGPGNVAEACMDIGATFVQYSTDYVFDGENEEGYDEQATPAPISKYGESKLAGEQAAQAACPQTYIIRTCKLFGKPGASDVSKSSFVDTMLTLAKDRDTLDVVDEEYGSPTYTPDLAKATRELIADANIHEPGVYHITNSDACTWYEFAKEIFAQAGVSITVNPVSSDAFPRPARRPKYSQLLNTKLPPLRSWKEALADYLSS